MGVCVCVGPFLSAKCNLVTKAEGTSWRSFFLLPHPSCFPRDLILWPLNWELNAYSPWSPYFTPHKKWLSRKQHACYHINFLNTMLHGTSVTHISSLSIAMMFVQGTYFIWQLVCHFTFLLCHVWVVGWMGCVNMINKLAESENKLLWDKIMTIFIDSRKLQSTKFDSRVIRWDAWMVTWCVCQKPLLSYKMIKWVTKDQS